MLNQDKIELLKTDISNANKVVFLTGAGVSTHSGIPDYRSKSGIYHGVHEKPEAILSEHTLFTRPKFFHNFVMTNMYFPAAKPNLIHNTIANICNQKGILITQNIDGLDTKAGNKHVIEFHGNLYNIYCTKCQQKVSYDAYKNNYLHQDCGGIIRPGIVLYGEAINSQILAQSINAIQQADLIIILGTSFVVYPFAQLLIYRTANAKIWAVNKTQIPVQGINLIIADAISIFNKL